MLFGLVCHAVIIRSRFQHHFACELSVKSFCEDAALVRAHAASSAFRDRDRWRHKIAEALPRDSDSPSANHGEIQWPRGGGKMAVSTDGDNLSVFSVAPVFFFVYVGELSKRFESSPTKTKKKTGATLKTDKLSPSVE